MDPSENPVSRSPRKELQGPRPPALKVGKDSHKIFKKPPVAPQRQKQQQQQEQQPPRDPVIIYTVSPKVIHTNPSEFMNLVQRLTGSNSASSSTPSPKSANPFNVDGGAISPAARFATIEKAKSPKEKKQQQVGDVEGLDMGQVIESSSLFPGILSPGPASLPPISPSLFASLPPDPNTFGFFYDISPGLHGNRNFIEGSFMPSPSTFFSPSIISPTSSVDLFNNLFDF
uniref:VQ motif-containing family protein n=1 Tax=Rhizophora mucronata TaxID=61149 RepID=A0A2P2IRU9_RHIMU